MLNILKQLGSAGKSQDATNLLHEDLVVVEQRVEPAKKAAQILHKKLLACLQSSTGLEAEKRMRKLPLMMLSISMAESMKDFDAESSIRRVLQMCCFMEKMLANILADFEMKVEKEVLEPLFKLSDDDLPEILRNKKQFAKLTTDWNYARTKCQASTGPQAKQDGLREEVEEAWRKLENIKDQYSADLYHFATKEDEYANFFINLLELQADYHKRSHEFLERNITELRENHSPKDPQVSLSNRRVYGMPLLTHLSESNREIASPIQECVHMLLRTGMKEEGLFRLAAAASVVKKLKNCLDHGTVDYSEFSTDPHAVAGAMKSYLRELPEPLMTFELYSEWFSAADEKDVTNKLQQYRVLLKKLPPENFNNLRYLLQFLSLLSEQQAVNRMTSSNIAIVLGPNLLWPRCEGEQAMFDMASASSVQVVAVVEPLINHCSSLFPEAVSFDIHEPPGSIDLTLKEKEKVKRTTSSSSSTASSSSSYHTPLTQTNSAASRDSWGYLPASSGSVGQDTRTTTRDNSVSSSSEQTQPNSTSQNPSKTPLPSMKSPCHSSKAFSSPITQLPTPATRTLIPNPIQAKTQTNQKPISERDQTEPDSTAPPNSPLALVKNALPFKPKRSFNQSKMPAQADDQIVVEYSKARATGPPKPTKPTFSSPAQPPVQVGSKTQPEATPMGPSSVPNKTNVKKPGVRAPKCPPPLPPPPLAVKQVPYA